MQRPPLGHQKGVRRTAQSKQAHDPVAGVMRLSIGVPAYNQGSFLGETLESLLTQSEPFAEIVVSDNHCTDNTADVLREFAGRVRVVRPPLHLKMVPNWNFTVSQLTGDWFSLLSSDDVALPNFAADVRRTVEATPVAAVLRAAWINIDNNGAAFEDRHLRVRAVTTPTQALYEQRMGPRGSFAAFALRRDIWQRVGGFPEEVSLLGDWGMWLLAGALSPTVYCDRPIAKYRTGHQPEVIRARHHIYAREMFTIYSSLLPRATELAGLGRPEWIAQSSREACRALIAAASRDFAPDERAQLIEAIRPWADATGEHKRFRKFAAGEILREGELSRFVMSRLRPLARRVLRALPLPKESCG